MKRITFDIETANDFIDGNFEPKNLDLALVCIHDSETGVFSCYTKEELPKLWPIIEKADMLVGYNSDHFDVPLLDKYYPGDLTKIRSLDLLKEVKNVLGRRLKLDNLAEATLGRKKLADGLQAVRWWAEGRYDLVEQYCIEDVRLTNDLYVYAREKNSLKYKDYDGVREIKLDTSGWESGGKTTLTHTLPF